jgi:hypothetical protein
MADIITVVDALTNTQIEREATAEEQAQIDLDKAEFEATKVDRVLDNLRERRNQALLESDWTQLPNAPLTDAKKAEWETYRQSLRDITNGLTVYEEILEVTLPTKPTENN